MESADVVIAGGGIMGCALAYQLAKRDVDVILLERDTLGSQSTGKCAGGVRQQFSMEANVRLQRLSVRLFEDFERETGQPADFRQIGYLFVLTLPQQVEDFRSNMEMWHRAGLTEARWVDPAEAARMVPVLNVDDVLGCTFCPTDGIASPADVTSGYASAARRRGARLKEGVEVMGIVGANGRVPGVRPYYGGAGINAAWAGLYESTPDHQAILGPVPEVEGFWCAAGFSGHGFMQAPAAALLLAQLLLDHDSEVDISPFAFTRFAKGALVHERNVI